MTHLNPFSYPARLFQGVYTIIIITLIEAMIFKYPWWRDIRNSKARRTIKFWASTLMYLMLFLRLLADACITFNYGKDSGLQLFSEVLLNLVYNTHSSCVFLLLSFFHNLFTQVIPEANFMHELEFKIYLAYSIITFVAYPIIQFTIFNIKELNFVVVPQLIYGAELLLSSSLLLYLIIRIKREEKNFHKKTSLLAAIKFLLASLIVVDVVIALTPNIINFGLIAGEVKYGANYTSYSLPQLQQLPIGLVDALTAIFSASYFPLALIIVSILNVGALVDIYTRKKRKTESSTKAKTPSSITATQEVEY